MRGSISKPPKRCDKHYTAKDHRIVVHRCSIEWQSSSCEIVSNLHVPRKGILTEAKEHIEECDKENSKSINHIAQSFEME